MGAKELKSSERNRNRDCCSRDCSEGSNRFDCTLRALARKGNALSACREDSARVSTKATGARAISAQNTEAAIGAHYVDQERNRIPQRFGPHWSFSSRLEGTGIQSARQQRSPEELRALDGRRTGRAYT